MAPSHHFAEIIPLGDSAAVVRFGDSIDLSTHQSVRALYDSLSTSPPHGSLELVPAYATVTVYYDPLKSTFEEIRRDLQRAVELLETLPDSPPETVEIPVCYGGDLGPDLEYVAEFNRLSCDEVIEIHSSPVYLVYMLGFTPGFPYLGGLSERIATPRRTSPRLQIPAGSVGIAGNQTGIYPLQTPGGWQLIGRTPLALFRPDRSPSTILRAGDQVRFRPVKTFSEALDGMQTP